jgi:hypothetical protein
MEVKKGYTELIVPHEGSKITFQHPAFRGTYANVANELDRAGLKRPTSPEVASLVYDAWKNPTGEHESEIISILKNNWLWEITRNLYLPKSNKEINNGVILDLDSQNLKFENGKLKMDKSDLIKRLNEGDSNVKFVPFGFKTGQQNLLEFAKNPYIVARYGEEGAEKISEVASKYKKDPYVWSFNSVNEEKVRMSALGGVWFDGRRLGVVGDSWGDSDYGRAFGVRAKRE